MLAGGDLIMTALAVSVIQDRGTPRGDVPGDLDAYNAYLASVDSQQVQSAPGGQADARSDPYWAGHDGDRILVPNEPGYPSHPAVDAGAEMPQRVAAEAALPLAGPPGYDQILLARRYAEPPSDDLVVETEYPS
jgi:hypothetical protein